MSDDVSTNDGGKYTILRERRGTTFVVTINRPEVRNALDGPTASTLAQALREFDRNETLAVAVLSGSGGTFCSGFDLKSVADSTRMPRVSEEGDGPWASHGCCSPNRSLPQSRAMQSPGD